MAKIRRAELYINSKKVGSMGNSSLSVNNNTDRMHTTDGVNGGTDGNPELELQFDMIVHESWPGAEQAVYDAADTQAEVMLGYLMGGKYKIAPYKFSQFRVASEPQRGTMMGSFTAINVGPAQTV